MNKAAPEEASHGLVPSPRRRQDPQDALAAPYVLANWITLVAEDHGWDSETVAHLAEIDPEQARAIPDGVVALTPVPELDRTRRHLERRPH